MTNLPITGDFTVTAVYGQSGKYWKDGHKGIDIVSSDKTVYGTCDGTVRVVAFDKNGWGNYVSVGDMRGRRHIFCHLDKVYVKPGDKITRTTVIGIMGSTGNVSGLHLHYQINDSEGNPVNPADYLGVPNLKGNYRTEEFGMSAYNDWDKVSSWAKDAVKKVTEYGIMQGDNNGNFNPKDNITREEVAMVMANFIKLGKE